MDTDSGAPAGRSALSYGSEGRPSRGGLNGQVSYTQRLTNLLTRPAGTGETTRDTGDARRGLCLVSETGRNVGDRGDARRSAHNPEVEGSNPSPATKARGPFSNRERAFCMWFVHGFVHGRLLKRRLRSFRSPWRRANRR